MILTPTSEPEHLSYRVETNVKIVFVTFVHVNHVYFKCNIIVFFLLGDFTCVPVEFSLFYTLINIIFSDWLHKTKETLWFPTKRDELNFWAIPFILMTKKSGHMFRLKEFLVTELVCTSSSPLTPFTKAKNAHIWDCHDILVEVWFI